MWWGIKNIILNITKDIEFWPLTSTQYEQKIVDNFLFFPESGELYFIWNCNNKKKKIHKNTKPYPLSEENKGNKNSLKCFILKCLNTECQKWSTKDEVD